jgi:hypothetical protein
MIRFTPIFRGLAVLALLAPALFGRADWGGLSVWEQLQFGGSSHVGFVQSIAVNDSSNETIVRISTLDSKSLIFKVCPGSSRMKDSEILTREKMELIRQAMSQGKKVRLSTESGFSGCLSHVELLDKLI